MKALSTAILVVAAVLAADSCRGRPTKPESRFPITLDEAQSAGEPKLTTSFAPVVRKAAPAVVNVFSTRTVKNPLSQIGPLLQDPLFRQFFGNDIPVQPRSLKEQSLGSGVIVSADGYVLTNCHVVHGATEIKVTLSRDSRDYAARVIGRDAQTDLAVLKIDGENLPSITFADSDKAQVGDVVLAVGNPFGVGQTVTTGIISAVRRGGLGIENYEDFIQTDASINPGNSGGPLVDTDGSLVAINTAILSKTGGSQGIGFAIPGNLARRIMEQLIKNGKVIRGTLGIMVQDLTADLAEQFDVQDKQGALVSEVMPGGAAAQAGLKAGDVIVAINGKPVKDSRNLKVLLSEYAPGTSVQLKLLSSGQQKTVTAALKERSEVPRDSDFPPPTDGSSALGGVRLADLDAVVRRAFDIPSEVTGAVIAGLRPDSQAAAAGLREGDVIEEINREPVTSASRAAELAEAKRGQQLLLRVWSPRASGWIILEPGAR